MAALRPVLLADLFEGVAGTRLGAFDGRAVTMLATDSRRVEPGALFFALPGGTGHGARHIADARRRGAIAAVTSRRDVATAGLAVFVTPHPALLLAPLSARLYGHPTRSLGVYGVTGTNGKTTTALMVARVLNACGVPAGHWTTTEVRAGAACFRPFWTTPPAPDLWRFLAACRDAAHQAAVLEVSSHGVAMGRIEGVPFTFGAATNLSADHIDFHGSLAAYAAAKRGFIHGLGPEALAVLNADDPVVRAFAPGARARVLTFGRDPAADLRLGPLEPFGSGVGCRVAVGPADLRPGGERTLELRLAVQGAHNARNAAVALAAALGRGLDPSRALEALASFAAPPRRLESRRVGPFTVVNDVAMNEASYETVLRWAEASVHRQVVVLCALRGHRGVDVTQAIGRVFARHARRLALRPLVVSLSRDAVAGMEVDHSVRAEELGVFLDVLRQADVPVEVWPDLGDAVRAATDRVEPGGLLLLLGTFGMDDGPRLAEAALCRRLGVSPPPAPIYLSQSYGRFDGECDAQGARREPS